MPIGSYLLGLALLALVAGFVARPFLRSPHTRPRRGSVSVAPAEPVADRQSTLLAIRDLDFDFRTGKVAEEDYTPLRQQLVREAAAHLQAEAASPTGASAEDEIEAAVRSLRQKRIAAGACPRCQTPAAAGDRFCARCGAPLSVQPEVAA